MTTPLQSSNASPCEIPEEVSSGTTTQSETRDAQPSPLVVGVIGGLGPEATLDFFAKVLRATPAERDQDHLHLIINNNPKVPNRNDAVAGTGPSCGPELAKSARVLASAGADLLVMPCNTAHAFEADIRTATDVPFMSLINETVTATRTRHPHVRKVGLLATSGCLRAALYQDAFAHAGTETLEPTGAALERFMTALYDIKAGRKEVARAAVLELARALIGEGGEGAEVLISGCTEVPLVFSAEDIAVPLLESTDILAHAVVRAASDPGFTLKHSSNSEGCDDLLQKDLKNTPKK